MTEAERREYSRKCKSLDYYEMLWERLNAENAKPFDAERIEIARYYFLKAKTPPRQERKK